jgi:hypothetical protein
VVSAAIRPGKTDVSFDDWRVWSAAAPAANPAQDTAPTTSTRP